VGSDGAVKRFVRRDDQVEINQVTRQLLVSADSRSFTDPEIRLDHLNSPFTQVRGTSLFFTSLYQNAFQSAESTRTLSRRSHGLDQSASVESTGGTVFL
jgi:hypothetical protein